MKFPVCASPAGAAGLLRALGGSAEATSVALPAWGQRNPEPGCSWLRSACSLPTVSSSSLSSPPCPDKLSSLGAPCSPARGCASAEEFEVFGVLIALSPCDFDVWGIKPVFRTVLG